MLQHLKQEVPQWLLLLTAVSLQGRLHTLNVSVNTLM